ncbi:MAG: hypothetical protein JO062_08280 [Bryobacterales bacterium]|nr:hypothetical protein [Bryobacterales bacterium]
MRARLWLSSAIDADVQPGRVVNLFQFSVISFQLRNCFFNSIGHDRGGGSMEEVQDSVTYTLQADSEVVDSIAQKVGFGPAQFVAQVAKTFPAYIAVVPRLSPHVFEPFQKRT